MTEILILTFILVGVFALVRFAKSDTFAGSAVRRTPHDELGYRSSPYRNRPA